MRRECRGQRELSLSRTVHSISRVTMLTDMSRTVVRENSPNLHRWSLLRPVFRFNPSQPAAELQKKELQQASKKARTEAKDKAILNERHSVSVLEPNVQDFDYSVLCLKTSLLQIYPSQPILSSLGLSHLLFLHLRHWYFYRRMGPAN